VRGNRAPDCIGAAKKPPPQAKRYKLARSRLAGLNSRRARHHPSVPARPAPAEFPVSRRGQPAPAPAARERSCSWMIRTSSIARAQGAYCTHCSVTRPTRSCRPGQAVGSRHRVTSVYRDPAGRYQLWYQAFAGDESRDRTRRCTVCYAESADGIHFTKPNLGLFDYNGIKDTAIVLVGNGGTSDRYGVSVVVTRASPMRAAATRWPISTSPGITVSSIPA